MDLAQVLFWIWVGGLLNAALHFSTSGLLRTKGPIIFPFAIFYCVFWPFTAFPPGFWGIKKREKV